VISTLLIGGGGTSSRLNRLFDSGHHRGGSGHGEHAAVVALHSAQLRGGRRREAREIVTPTWLMMKTLCTSPRTHAAPRFRRRHGGEKAKREPVSNPGRGQWTPRTRRGRREERASVSSVRFELPIDDDVGVRGGQAHQRRRPATARRPADAPRPPFGSARSRRPRARAGPHRRGSAWPRPRGPAAADPPRPRRT